MKISALEAKDDEQSANFQVLKDREWKPGNESRRLQPLWRTQNFEKRYEEDLESNEKKAVNDPNTRLLNRKESRRVFEDLASIDKSLMHSAVEDLSHVQTKLATPSTKFQITEKTLTAVLNHRNQKSGNGQITGVAIKKADEVNFAELHPFPDDIQQIQAKHWDFLPEFWKLFHLFVNGVEPKHSEVLRNSCGAS